MTHGEHQWDGAEPALTESHFQQLLGILRRRRELIIATAIVGTTLVGFGGLLIPTRAGRNCRAVTTT